MNAIYADRRADQHGLSITYAVVHLQLSLFVLKYPSVSRYVSNICDIGLTIRLAHDAVVVFILWDITKKRNPPISSKINSENCTMNTQLFFWSYTGKNLFICYNMSRLKRIPYVPLPTKLSIEDIPTIRVY